MKIWKTVGKTAVSVWYAAGLFHCLIYGAPQEKTVRIPYMLMAGITCIFVPVSFLTGIYSRKLYRENQELHKRINSLQKSAAKLDK